MPSEALSVQALLATLRDSSNVLAQRSALDLLVCRFPLTAPVLSDERLAELVAGAMRTLVQRDQSLTRRLYAWLAGRPSVHGAAEPQQQSSDSRRENVAVADLEKGSDPLRAGGVGSSSDGTPTEDGAVDFVRDDVNSIDEKSGAIPDSIAPAADDAERAGPVSESVQMLVAAGALRLLRDAWTTSNEEEKDDVAHESASSPSLAQAFGIVASLVERSEFRGTLLRLLSYPVICLVYQYHLAHPRLGAGQGTAHHAPSGPSAAARRARVTTEGISSLLGLTGLRSGLGRLGAMVRQGLGINFVDKERAALQREEERRRRRTELLSRASEQRDAGDGGGDRIEREVESLQREFAVLKAAVAFFARIPSVPIWQALQATISAAAAPLLGSMTAEAAGDEAVRAERPWRSLSQMQQQPQYPSFPWLWFSAGPASRAKTDPVLSVLDALRLVDFALDFLPAAAVENVEGAALDPLVGLFSALVRDLLELLEWAVRATQHEAVIVTATAIAKIVQRLAASDSAPVVTQPHELRALIAKFGVFAAVQRPSEPSARAAGVVASVAASGASVSSPRVASSSATRSGAGVSRARGREASAYGRPAP